jgi:hypothetical protein
VSSSTWRSHSQNHSQWQLEAGNRGFRSTEKRFNPNYTPYLLLKTGATISNHFCVVSMYSCEEGIKVIVEE